MSPTECPECGQPMGEEELSCGSCGWPPAAQAEGSSLTEATEEIVPSVGQVVAPDAPGPFPYLMIGLVIGLLLGSLITWMTMKEDARPLADSQPRSSGKPTGSGQLTFIQNANPDALRMRELQWKQDETGFCRGQFEVISAPPSVKSLRFSVMDAEGKTIGGDKITAPQGIKPRSVLELGFDVKSCAAIKKWKVQVEKD